MDAIGRKQTQYGSQLIVRGKNMKSEKIKETISKLRHKYELIPIVLFALYFLALHLNTPLKFDDLVYINDLQNRTVFQWCKGFYLTWGGRVPILLLAILFLQIPHIVWIVANWTVMTACMIYVLKYVRLLEKERNEKVRFLIVCVVGMLFCLITDDIISMAVQWVTGSFNFLWPATTLLIGLYPFVAYVFGREARRTEKIVAVPAVFYTCYAEQTAAVFVCMAIACIVIICITKGTWNIKKDSPYLLGLYIFGVINAIIMFAAPGNYVRADAELIHRLPTFDSFNWMDKLTMGLVHFMKGFFAENLGYYIGLLFVLALIALRRGITEQISVLLLFLCTPGTMKFLFALEDNVIWQVYDVKTLAGIGVTCLYLLLLAWVIYILLYGYSWQLATVTSLLFLAHAAASVMLGMSPTVYGSGTRIFFCSYILLTAVIAICFFMVMQDMVAADEVRARLEQKGLKSGLVVMGIVLAGVVSVGYVGVFALVNHRVAEISLRDVEVIQSADDIQFSIASMETDGRGITTIKAVAENGEIAYDTYGWSTDSVGHGDYKNRSIVLIDESNPEIAYQLRTYPYSLGEEGEPDDHLAEDGNRVVAQVKEEFLESGDYVIAVLFRDREGNQYLLYQ